MSLYRSNLKSDPFDSKEEYISMTLSHPESTMPPVNKQEENGIDQQISMEIGRKIIKKKWNAFALRASVTAVLFVFLARSVSWSTLIMTLPHVRQTELLLGLA